MSLDTKYRPRTYGDVLGQEGTVAILRQFVHSGKGFHQSVLFAGPWGSGKTTLARIYARALLCDAPNEGNPCDQCPTCLDMLAGVSTETFVEVDAATNSGKADVQRIVEEVQFSTFSGKRRLYLLDESHQLSPGALDALLKPMEENTPGTGDKKLVCLFCTTEPEKMRATVLSRCAPAFKIRPAATDAVAKRLFEICEAEGLRAEPEALDLIAQISEAHIRDAIKAVEGVSMMGGDISTLNVKAYLHLGINDTVLDILSSIPVDLQKALLLAQDLLVTTSPGVLYTRLSEVALLAFQASLGAQSIPPYWDAAKVQHLGQSQGAALVSMALQFSTRPSRPTGAMLLCDLSALHLGGNMPPLVLQRALPQDPPQTTPIVRVEPTPVQPPLVSVQPPVPPGFVKTGPDIVDAPTSGSMANPVAWVTNGVYVHAHAIKKADTRVEPEHEAGLHVLDPVFFAKVLGAAVAERYERRRRGRSKGL